MEIAREENADGNQMLVYRSFESEEAALRDIYRLNTFDEAKGRCICCHSRDVLKRLDLILSDTEPAYKLAILRQKVLDIAGGTCQASISPRCKFVLHIENAQSG